MTSAPRPAIIDIPDLKTGASAAKVLERLLRRREQTMMIDKIGDTNVYISGIYAMRCHAQLAEANISHVVSIMRGKLDQQLFAPYKHLHIEVNDDDDENLIEHFKTTNEFIEGALAAGGSVLVHCAMGVSRSATVASAYLIYTKQIPPDAAMALIRETRPVICPNLNFRRQLELYYDNLGEAIKDLDNVAAYQRYLYRKEVEMSRLAHKAPTITHYASDEDQESRTGLKCKMCRRTLALSTSFVEHIPNPPATSTTAGFMGRWNAKFTGPSSQSCQHHFVEPVKWMQPELEKGELEGKLDCPKCNAKVGSYAWQGMRCSCGGWVVPAISLARGRVDEVPRPVL